MPLDLGLPSMDGEQVAARLKAEEDLRGATVLAVSDYGLDEDRRSREAGFDHHLVKPIEHDALLSLLSHSGI